MSERGTADVPVTDEGSGSRSANQARSEPVPPTPAHASVAPSGASTVGDTSEAEPYPATPVLDASPDRPAIAVPGKPDGEVDTRS